MIYVMVKGGENEKNISEEFVLYFIMRTDIFLLVFVVERSQ